MLSKENLQELKAFIEKRSLRFSDPMILLEILDHFACKVEEIQEKNPGISLQAAMEEAHRAFGVRGFAPLADQAENSLLLRYKRIANGHIRNLLCSYPFLLIVAAGLFCYQLLSLWLPAEPLLGCINSWNLPVLAYVLIAGLVRSRAAAKWKKYPLILSMPFRCSLLGRLYEQPALWILLLASAGVGVGYPPLQLGLFSVMLMCSIFDVFLVVRLHRDAAADAATTEKHLSAMAS